MSPILLLLLFCSEIGQSQSSTVVSRSTVSPQKSSNPEWYPQASTVSTQNSILNTANELDYSNLEDITRKRFSSDKTWRCSGTSNNELVKNLKTAFIIKSQMVYETMLSIDRGNYVRDLSVAYQDSPSSIGYGGTISAPHMHAYGLEAVLPAIIQAVKRVSTTELNYTVARLQGENELGKAKNETQVSQNGESKVRILDVGSGSGYLTACLSRLVENVRKNLDVSQAIDSRVIGIEHIAELVDFAKENLQKSDSDLSNVEILRINGWDGYPREGPYDVIHVGAAADGVPEALVKQLSIGGRMVIPIGKKGEGQEYAVLTKLSSSASEAGYDIISKKFMNVVYVPLAKPSTAREYEL